MKARSASAFSPISNSNSNYASPSPTRHQFGDYSSSHTDVFAAKGLSALAEEGERLDKEMKREANKDTDALLGSLLQSGGLLAKPTVSPHFGRYYTPPRHDPFIRPETTEGMDVEDRL